MKKLFFLMFSFLILSSNLVLAELAQYYEIDQKHHDFGPRGTPGGIGSSSYYKIVGQSFIPTNGLYPKIDFIFEQSANVIFTSPG